MSPLRAARLAGVGYLIIIVAGIFAEFFVRSSLIVSGDATATANNIMASESLFRIGIAGDLVMLVFDAIVALALYVLLKPVHRSLALMATIFRLIHTAVYGVNLLNLVVVTLLLSGAGYLAAFEAEQLHALVLTFLDAHGIGYAIGLVFFAVHAVLLGYLVVKSGFIPRILGILLLVASAGYIVDSFANVLLANYADYEMILGLTVFVPAVIAELAFALWLLVKGANVQRAHPPVPSGPLGQAMPSSGQGGR